MGDLKRHTQYVIWVASRRGDCSFKWGPPLRVPSGGCPSLNAGQEREGERGRGNSNKSHRTRTLGNLRSSTGTQLAMAETETGQGGERERRRGLPARFAWCYFTRTRAQFIITPTGWIYRAWSALLGSGLSPALHPFDQLRKGERDWGKAKAGDLSSHTKLTK